MMKWWGWGDSGFSFPMAEKPELWPWIARALDIDEVRYTHPVPRSQVRLPAPVRDDNFLRALAGALRPEQIRADEDERLLHCYGKSFPDLFLVRRGLVRRAPDLVLYPESHVDVEAVMRLAAAHEVVLIPFGGGTNIVGGVNPREPRRMVATLDMARMNRLLSLDPRANLAVIEAGALGPKLEKDLQARGFSLGHFPDSFEFSSLGGWIATRSAGMQSDAYGKIEDMVVAVKMVTPQGTLATRPVPASSSGPDMNRVVAGSEGVLGVITECTMRVHPLSPAKDYRGFLFPGFSDGVAAMRECVDSDTRPNLIRLQDPFETQLGIHMKAPKKGLVGLAHKLMKKLLVARGYGSPALLIVGIEGDAAYLNRAKRHVHGIIKRRRGFDLGTSVGATWSKDKYNLPYLRDYVMDRAIMCDVAETSTTWDNVINLYEKVRAAAFAKFAADGHPGKGFIGCHLSHTYKTGACLYFTYAAVQQPGRELEQYYEYKRMFTEAFINNGATLTHHHAVGSEHRPWMEQEISKTGLTALRALKEGLDPQGLMNPGKLIPADEPFADWAQPTQPATVPREAAVRA